MPLSVQSVNNYVGCLYDLYDPDDLLYASLDGEECGGLPRFKWINP